MRKILLGTTAVVGAALMGPSLAQAQEAPTVRIGGYFRAYYGYTIQSGRHSVTPSQDPTNVGGQTDFLPPTGSSVARLGKHDFSTDAEIHVFVNGKTANGMTYGAVIEIEFDGLEGRQVLQQRASSAKTTASIDEMYAFVAFPTLGQIRFGDEDGPLGGLMNAGWITNFGTGGIFGDFESFVTRQQGARTQTAPGALGDSTKIIYLSPQFFGFDFGASWAFNYNEGEDTGCNTNAATGWCDTAYAFAGASNFGLAGSGPSIAARRNEYQLAARWRGSLGPVGIAVAGGYIGSTAARELQVTTGAQAKVLNNLNIMTIGAQATAFGFTLGAAWIYGDYNYFWGNTMRGDRPGNQYTVGLSYTVGPFTIGANYVFGTFEGGNRLAYSQTTGTLVPGSAGNQAGMRRWGYGIGANYRLAPGMDIVAEFVRFTVAERNRDFDPSSPGVQDRSRSQVVLTGVRLAF